MTEGSDKTARAPATQAAGRKMSGLEAMTVRTCPMSSRAMECHPVQLDAGNLGQLQSSWTWSHIGQYQVHSSSTLLKYQLLLHHSTHCQLIMCWDTKLLI